MGAPEGRRALRTVSVECPAWSDEPFEMREPRVQDYLASLKVESDQEKAVHLLGCMVLGKDGKPVGKQAILDGPLAALGQLSRMIPALTGEAEPDAPLEQAIASDTA